MCLKEKQIMMGSTGVNLPQLSQDNFDHWKFRIRMILEEKQVHDVLEKDVTSITDENEKKDFLRKDAKAKSIVVQCITDKHLDLVKDCTTAKEMIKILGDIFQRKSTFTKLHLKRKLLTLKQQNNEKLEDHFFKFDSIIRELEGAGCKLEESDKVCHLLLTMSSKYEQVITAIETVNSDISMDFVRSRLLDEELKLKGKDKHGSIKDEVVFKANTNIVCYKCNKIGHKAIDCRTQSKNRFSPQVRGRGMSRGTFSKGRGNYYQRQNTEEANHSEISFTALSCEMKETSSFILDSGATEHIVSESCQELAKKVLKLEKSVKIHIANGDWMFANSKAEFEVMYHGQKIKLEALLVRNVKHNLLSVGKLTRNGYKVIFSKDSVKISGPNFTIDGQKMNNLYLVDLELSESKASELNYVNTKEQTSLWHRRLGHLNRKSLKMLGLPVSDDQCEKCLEGKAKRQSFNRVVKSTKHIGELIHSDISGPVKQTTNEGHKYFQVIVDDYSHFCMVYLLKEKSEAGENLINYIKLVRTQFGNKTKRLRVDNGGEFTSKYLQNYCKSKGIIIEYTVPYTPQQNGVSERMNRTLLEKVRTKFAETNLPRHLWGEAIRTCAYELNRSPTAALNGGIPAEKWYGKNDLTLLRVFGSKAWVTKIPKLDKLEPRGIPAVMVGYCGGGYRLWVPQENEIIISRDVVFDEYKIMFEENKINVIENSEEDKLETSNEIAQSENSLTEDEQSMTEDYEKSDMEMTNKRIRRLPTKFNEYELYSAYCLFAESDPKSFSEAVKHKEWKKAIEEEINAHQRYETWEPAILPKNKTAIDTKWIFKTKPNNIKKARLVARGYQEETIHNIYAPVARMSTVRLLLAQAVIKNYSIRQMDIPTAFLNGELTTDIYIKAPEGIGNVNDVYRLKKALYGLKEAPRCWNDRLDKFLKQNGFQRSRNDFCLYTKDKVNILIFVDDILIVNEKEDNIVEHLKKEFKAKDLGEIKNFLGMHIERNNGEMKISQIEMIKKLLEKFNMQNCKGNQTPMEVNFQPDLKEQIVNVPYRELIGSLLYISMISRPDIVYATSFLSKYLDKPTQSLWNAGKRILRYLKETINMTLTYKAANNGEYLEAYSDSDWAGDRSDRKSVSGSVILYYGNPIMWFTRKQQSVALSSCEAEYIAAAEATSELLYIKGVVELINNDSVDSHLYLDNQSAIHMIENYENSKRSKHIDIKVHFIKDIVEKDMIKLFYVRSEDNIADIFTKALGSVKHVRFTNLLGLL